MGIEDCGLRDALHREKFSIFVSQFRQSFLAYVEGTAAQDTRTQVRLVGGTRRSGRVEVRRTSSEAWGTICDHYWEQTEANVVCKMLGFR